MIKERNCWSLYRHTSPSGNIYIGITSQYPVYKRWQYGNAYKHCSYFYNAIKKYGWNGIKHEILFSNLDESTAKSLEQKLINHYKKLKCSYNITDGGDGTVGYHHTQESKELMRKLKLGKKLSEEHKLRLSQAHKGRIGSMAGKRHSEETKLKMSQVRTGKKCPRKMSKEEETKIYRAAQKTCRRVAQYSTEGELLNVFNSLNEAAQYISGSRAHLTDCCKGKTKMFKGYIWNYYDKRED